MSRLTEEFPWLYSGSHWSITPTDHRCHTSLRTGVMPHRGQVSRLTEEFLWLYSGPHWSITSTDHRRHTSLRSSSGCTVDHTGLSLLQTTGVAPHRGQVSRLTEEFLWLYSRPQWSVDHKRHASLRTGVTPH